MKKKPLQRTKTTRRKPSAVGQTSLLDAPGVRPIAAQFVSAAQLLSSFPAFDSARLRRLADSDLAGSINPDTGAPWLPKPRGGKWHFEATAAGLAAYLTHQATRRDGLPENYAGKTDFCGITKFPEAMLDYAIAHGCRCKDDHGRISLAPFLTFFAPLFVKIFSGGGQHIAGMEAFEELDLNVERAGLTREQRTAQARENALADGRIHDLNHAERRMLEICGPLREAWQTAIKKAHRLGPTQPDIYRQILLHDLPNFLTRLQQDQPALGHYELAAGHGSAHEFEI